MSFYGWCVAAYSVPFLYTTLLLSSLRFSVVGVVSRAHRIFTLLTTFTRATGPVVRRRCCACC